MVTKDETVKVCQEMCRSWEEGEVSVCVKGDDEGTTPIMSS